MSNSRLCACGVFWLVLIFFFSLSPARAETSLVVSGIGTISGSQISQAEKIAYDDAIYKAYLELALRQVPASSAVDLSQKLKGFVASRGTQDIIQYQIASRSQQDNVLILNLELKINDIPLKEWLQSQAFTTPLGLRPQIMLAVLTRGPGASERYEWWSGAKPKGYSPFEAQLALRLKNVGENVSEMPDHISVLSTGPDRVLAIASNSGADLVITGSVMFKSADTLSTESRLDISLLDVKTRQRLFTSAISLKGTVDVRTMNELLISAVLDQLRSEITKKVVVINPVIREKELCIEDVKEFDIYQSMFNTLRSMDTVTKITVSRIQGHTICHTIRIKGTLQDILDSLKQKQIAQADMRVEGDIASIRLIEP
jgi:hypothetical protein